MVTDSTNTPIEIVSDEIARHFVVGIGASAGGLEALELFFRHLPSKHNLVFVVVQHLSPDFESLMDKLLARETLLPIQMIEDGIRVKPRNVYLLPPKKEVIFSEGCLLLAERSASRELSFPIDNFFRSLAQDAGQRAIAVVLSGTGSDGSRGICEVHEAGGYVLSQSEASAKFDGMPRSACDTGIVDSVMAPGEMGEAIIAYTSSPLVASRIALSGTSIDGPTYAILNLLKKRYEIDFNQYKISTIGRRIERRIMLSGSENIVEYTKRLRSEPAELDALYRDLLIGVTGFFRDREVFERLELDVIPALMAKLEHEQEFRAWVVGTATGEEAYSLAILLTEASEAMDRQDRVKIFASDVHPGSLEAASRGIYQKEHLGGLTAEQQDRYFNKKSDGYHASSELRKKVVFVHHNVITNAPFTNLDMVTCRNVFIYFTPETQKKVLSLFHFGLKMGGTLCLGSSETPGELSHEFEAIDDKCRIYTKHRDISLPSSMRMAFPQVKLSVPPAPTMHSSTPKLSESVSARDLMGSYDTLLERFMPPSLLIGEDNELLHSFGDATRLLRVLPGRPSKNVLDLVQPPLRSAVSATLRRANHDQPAVVQATLPGEGEDFELLRITAERFGEDSNRTLVLFETESAPKNDALPKTEPVEVSADAYRSEEYEALERDLQRAKDSIKSTIEESQTTTEELQATNEQLTASNEELQSTNEELHSVNEELYTVNAEHQRKIDELIELTDDMDNLLNSTNVHTIFLDRQLNIRRFTPGIGDTFNLIPQDVGRRLDTFTHNIRGVRVVERVKEVVELKEKYEHEVQDKNDNWYLLRILPYTTRGQVDGAVVTLIDITSLKQAESKLAELSEIVEHSDDAIFRQDVDGTIRTWNRGAERLFGRPATKVLGRHVEMLGLRCQDIDAEQMLKLVECGQSLEHVEARYTQKDGTVADVALSLSPIRDPQGNVIGASSIARDVTRHKQAEAKVREAVRRRDDFLAMLSHELRNPLAAVLNATNLLGEAENNLEATVEAKDVIDHNVRHVARILDDLLDVSRITNDKINLHREVVDLSALMIDVVECVQHRVDAKQQELHVLPSDDPLFVEGDIGRLQQMQVNLLVNSSKYTSDGGRIEYRVEPDGDDAMITIKDNGVGIEESLLESIFEPFVQAEQTLDRAQGGMGLGLTLVSKVTDAHQGSVSVQSEGVGRGSVFSVRIPLTRKRPQRRVEVTLQDDDDMKIMIVEDNDGVRKMLARTLELKGFEVCAAAGGRAALQLIEEFQPTVAIIDIGLPDLNGYEVAREIRQMPEYKDLLLVAVTGYGRDRDRDTAISSGFDIHLVKPLDPNELLRAIAEKYGLTRPPRPHFLDKAEKKSGDKSKPLPPPMN